MVIADNLTGIVDGLGYSLLRAGRGVVQRGVAAVAVEKARCAAGVIVIADNLTGTVDAVGKSVLRAGRRVVQRGVAAATVKETVVAAAAIVVISSDLACIVHS